MVIINLLVHEETEASGFATGRNKGKTTETINKETALQRHISVHLFYILMVVITSYQVKDG